MNYYIRFTGMQFEWVLSYSDRQPVLFTDQEAAIDWFKANVDAINLAVGPVTRGRIERGEFTCVALDTTQAQVDLHMGLRHRLQCLPLKPGMGPPAALIPLR